VEVIQGAERTKIEARSIGDRFEVHVVESKPLESGGGESFRKTVCPHDIRVGQRVTYDRIEGRKDAVVMDEERTVHEREWRFIGVAARSVGNHADSIAPP
jgi:hypothetical protein